ncbi:MAG TPA: hypothetical protein VGB37_14855 [Candidatus Lokiarchaeia archaeon]
MIEELKIAIDEADRINSKKSKEVLLKIAMLKEENQQGALDLVKLMLESRR